MKKVFVVCLLVGMSTLLFAQQQPKQRSSAKNQASSQTSTSKKDAKNNKGKTAAKQTAQKKNKPGSTKKQTSSAGKQEGADVDKAVEARVMTATEQAKKQKKKGKEKSKQGITYNRKTGTMNIDGEEYKCGVAGCNDYGSSGNSKYRYFHSTSSNKMAMLEEYCDVPVEDGDLKPGESRVTRSCSVRGDGTVDAYHKTYVKRNPKTGKYHGIRITVPPSAKEARDNTNMQTLGNLNPNFNRDVYNLKQEKGLK